MHPFRKKLAKIPTIKVLSSVKIAVSCLSLLFILTLWGTIDQVSDGLYLAQERFFNSWFFIFWGFFPFPGARLVLWVMFLNLVCVATTKLVYRWSKSGITVIHCGLLLFFVSAFVTFHTAEESNVTLLEGEGTNISSAYHNWELAIWTQKENKNQVVAFDSDHLKNGQVLDFEKFGFTVTIQENYRNCEAYGQTEMSFGSSPKIESLKAIPLNKAPEKNSPGMSIVLGGLDEGPEQAILFGREESPIYFSKEGQPYYIQLRLKRFPMPFIIKLKEFTMEQHPNTQIARSYESLVEVISGGVSREVLISMNEPLRHKNYTFYQASYSIDQLGRERSTLAVVKNRGRLLPYIATFVTVSGLLIHMLIMAFSSRRRKKGNK